MSAWLELEKVRHRSRREEEDAAKKAEVGAHLPPPSARRNQPSPTKDNSSGLQRQSSMMSEMQYQRQMLQQQQQQQQQAPPPQQQQYAGQGQPQSRITLGAQHGSLIPFLPTSSAPAPVDPLMSGRGGFGGIAASSVMSEASLLSSRSAVGGSMVLGSPPPPRRTSINAAVPLPVSQQEALAALGLGDLGDLHVTSSARPGGPIGLGAPMVGSPAAVPAHSAGVTNTSPPKVEQAAGVRRSSVEHAPPLQRRASLRDESPDPRSVEMHAGVVASRSGSDGCDAAPAGVDAQAAAKLAHIPHIKRRTEKSLLQGAACQVDDDDSPVGNSPRAQGPEHSAESPEKGKCRVAAVHGSGVFGGRRKHVEAASIERSRDRDASEREGVFVGGPSVPTGGVIPAAQPPSKNNTSSHPTAHSSTGNVGSVHLDRGNVGATVNGHGLATNAISATSSIGASSAVIPTLQDGGVGALLPSGSMAVPYMSSPLLGGPSSRPMATHIPTMAHVPVNSCVSAPPGLFSVPPTTSMSAALVVPQRLRQSTALQTFSHNGHSSASLGNVAAFQTPPRGRRSIPAVNVPGSSSVLMPAHQHQQQRYPPQQPPLRRSDSGGIDLEESPSTVIVGHQESGTMAPLTHQPSLLGQQSLRAAPKKLFQASNATTAVLKTSRGVDGAGGVLTATPLGIPAARVPRSEGLAVAAAKIGALDGDGDELDALLRRFVAKR